MSRDKVNAGSRSALAAKASVYGLAGRVVMLLVSLVSRTIFIQLLGTYYLGVNSLYTDVLNVLSLSELGIGTAMTFALYAPVANRDDEKTKEVLQLYRRAYRVVALVVALAGLALVPLLPAIISDAGGLSASELRLYFVIFLTNTVVSYFVSYKYGLVSALQQTYVRTAIELATSLACEAVKLVVLLATSNFLAYLLANTATLVVSRAVIALYLNRRYPLLAQKPERKLPTAERERIVREVRSLSVHQFSSVAVHATDSIIISAVPALGLAMVGLVSNYTTIVNNVSNLLLVVLGSVTAGFGNLAATESPRRFGEVFDETHFVSFWLFGVCAACLFVLLPPFVTLWLGEGYLIDTASFLLMVTNFYLQGQCSIYNNARIAKGNFGKDSGWSLVQALSNLVVSVAGALLIGLPGVYVGTIASRLVLFVSRPIVTSQLLFDRSPRAYFEDSLRYLLVVCCATTLCALVCAPLLARQTVVSFCAATAACFVLANVVFWIAFRKSGQLRSVASRVADMLGKEPR